MADEGIKKVTVLKEEFPPLAKLGEEVYGHILRYRIVSEDKNIFSHWSKITPLTLFSTQSPPPQVVGELTISGSSITIVWDDEINRPRYDIFVSFDGGDFFYHGTSPTHTYSIIAPVLASSVEVAIQIDSINKERSDILTICELSDTIES
jgi:hypothetical protein